MINVKTNEKKTLNNNCGAEAVHKEKIYPSNFEPANGISTKGCSFDGDADRLIYFTEGQDGKPIVIDGDKQFVLIVTYIKELLTAIGVAVPLVYVNTAYSNGSANDYLASKQITRVCVPTGVKNATPVV